MWIRSGSDRTPSASAPADALSSAAISFALSTECAAYAQLAIDRALLR